MSEPIEKQIVKKIKKAKRGTLFFVDDFIGFGDPKTVGKALERMVNSNLLNRVARGIYTRPRIDKIAGVVNPDIEVVVKAIARRDRARILPTGSYALYKLGLTSQVPLNIVYYTDASARKIKVGNFTIVFKRTAAKNLSTIGDISKLAIQAMKDMGVGNVSSEALTKIVNLLKMEEPFHLQHDLKLAPKWIKKLIESRLKGDINVR